MGVNVRFTKRRTTAVAASVLALAIAVSGCGSSDDDSSTTSSGDDVGAKVALLLPESKTARYESKDRPFFTAKLKELCPKCEVLYSNADQDASKQQSQADAALTNGAKVLVLDPVDASSASSIVAKAKAQNVPVISYDRLVKDSDVDYYVSFDNEKVGRLQGQALLDALEKAGTTNKGSIIMINGSPTDPNAAQFKKGAHSVLDGKVTIGKEYDTPDWSPNKAQDEAQQGITALGKANVIGVYAANDGTAGGAIAALKGASFTTLPPVTGQDAEVAGIQRILAGEQYSTVYKAIKPQADKAAEIAADLAKGKTPESLPSTQNNGKKDVPSSFIEPVTVTKDNIKDTVIKDNFWTVAEICTAAYAAACAEAGIS